MKKYWYKTAVMMLAAGMFVACSDDDDPAPAPPADTSSTDAYIVNTGNWGTNDGSIQGYNIATGTVSEDLFKAANGRGIGDAQDLCIYGSKLYVTCTTSSKIEVLDKACKIIKTIPLTNEENQPLSPRFMTAHDGNIYFTAYDGTVSRLDTISLAVTNKVEVGPNPEALTYANGKLYVNLSDYFGTGTGSVAVVDVKSFTKTKELETVPNPYDESFTAKNGKVYFTSAPYAESASSYSHTLQCIDPQTDVVTELCQASKIAINGDKIYLILSDFRDAENNSISVYNMNTQEVKKFIDFSDIEDPSFIDVDPASGDVYIGNRSNSSLNDIYVYGSDGTFKKSFETGAYTTRIRFVKK